MSQHWLFQIGDGRNFYNSVAKNAWSLFSKTPCDIQFKNTARKGDLLWFVLGKSNKLIVAVAEFERIEERILGPLIPLTITNGELGWEGHFDPDYLIFFKNCLDLTQIKNPICANRNFRQGKLLYEPSKKGTDLPAEWAYLSRCLSDGILKYSLPKPPSAELIRSALSKKWETDEAPSEGEEKGDVVPSGIPSHFRFACHEGVRLVTGTAKYKQSFNSDAEALAYAIENGYNCVTVSRANRAGVNYYFKKRTADDVREALDRPKVPCDAARRSFYINC